MTLSQLWPWPWSLAKIKVKLRTQDIFQQSGIQIPHSVHCPCQVGLRGCQVAKFTKLGLKRTDWRPCNCIKMQFELPVDSRTVEFDFSQATLASQLPVGSCELAIFESLNSIECRCHHIDIPTRRSLPLGICVNCIDSCLQRTSHCLVARIRLRWLPEDMLKERCG